ncbi:MAG: questin oxidase family protein [Mesorhizobium sp.]
MATQGSAASSNAGTGFPDLQVADPAPIIARIGVLSAEFPEDLANHLPMILEGIARMGASAKRLEEFAAFYIADCHVPPQPAATRPIDRQDWTAGFGDRSREGDYRAFFQGEVQRLGAHSAILTYLPTLIPGVAASATHAMMRLAYAVMRNDPVEVANALGYWSATYLALPSPLRDGRECPIELLLSLRNEPKLTRIDPGSTLLWRWIKATGETPEFQAKLGRIQRDEHLLEKMRGASLTFYAGTMSFEALHALTGCHWIRLIRQAAGNHYIALASHFWEVVMSLYGKVDLPALPSAAEVDDIRNAPSASIEAIAAAAVASNDEHDHSLCFSALEEFRHYGDRLYLVLASRRMGLV